MTLAGKLEIRKAGTMKTTLEIPDDLFREAKAMAVLEGIKLKDFVAESLRLRVKTKKRLPAGRPSRRAADAADAGASTQPTLHDRFRKYCGIVKSGVGDLSTNPKHMEGFGED